MYKFKYRRTHILTCKSEVFDRLSLNEISIKNFIKEHNHFYYCGNLLYFYEIVSMEKLPWYWSIQQWLMPYMHSYFYMMRHYDDHMSDKY
jgi:hypothetical protein